MSTTNNTFGVAFYLKKQKTTQAGESPIYTRITVNGKRIEISVKRSVEENNWNPVKGMAKGSREEIIKLNKYLDQFKAVIIDSYQQLLLQKNLSPQNF
jgi:predicted nucleic acid-binding protein